MAVLFEELDPDNPTCPLCGMARFDLLIEPDSVYASALLRGVPRSDLGPLSLSSEKKV